MNKRELGNRMETAAAKYLNEHGHVILERNYYTRSGEIDIISKDGPYLVFTEVKYRNETDCGLPSEAVDARKRTRIIKSARRYIYEHAMNEDEICVRFDVIAILNDDIVYYKGAFEA